MRFILILPASLAILAAGAAHAQFDPAQMIEQADANHDGVVTRAEFQAARTAKFDMFDRNHDGVITASDFDRIAKFRPQAAQRVGTIIAQADANGDGRVTRDELTHAKAPIFDMADVNHDGQLDAGEIAAARTKLTALRQGR